MKIKEFETRQELYTEIPRGGIGFEAGVCKGMNAIHLYQIAKPSKLYLCDIWTDKHPDGMKWGRPSEFTDLWYSNHSNLVCRFFEDEIENGTVQLMRGYVSDFLINLDDNSLDWIYLDSAHVYDCISIEIDIALQKVRSGGLILGHDYNPAPDAWGASVIRAVNERIQDGDMIMESITIEKWPSYLCRVV